MRRSTDFTLKVYDGISVGSAWLTLLFGIFFFFCWQVGLYSYLKAGFIDWLFPYSTCICLTLSGFAFLSLIYCPKIFLNCYLSVPVFFISALRLFEIYFHADLGISSFLLKTLVKTPPEFPSMHSIGAINYLIVSLIFLFWPQRNKFAWIRTVLVLGCLIIIFFALEGMAVHLLLLKSSYLVFSVPIDFFAGATLIILTSGMICWGFYLDRINKIKENKWFPIIVSAAVFSFNTFFIFSLLQQKWLISQDNIELFSRLNNTLVFIIFIAGLVSTIVSGGIIYLLQKIKDKSKRLENIKGEFEAAKSILEVINETDSIPVASEKILNILHQVYGIKILIYWNWNHLKKKFDLVQYSSRPEIFAPHFEASCRSFESSVGVLFESEFALRKLIWDRDFGSGKDVRSSAAKVDGIQEVLAFPVFENEKLIGVLELFAKAPIFVQEEKSSIVLLENVGKQFSIFVERRAIEIVRKELTSIFTYSFDAIYTLDLDYKIRQWNRSAERLYGWREDEIIGESVLNLYPRERLHEFEELKKITTEKISERHLETQRLRKDKNLVWVRILYSPIYNEAHELSAISVISENIEERMKIEKAKNEFVSMVTHELRSPLTSIVGALGLLKKNHEIPSSANELIVIADKNADRLKKIIEDILDVEQIQLGQLYVKSVPFLLDPVIKESILLATPFAMERKISLLEPSNPSSVQIKADPDRLLQVLLNLLSNAIKFSSPDGRVMVQMEKQKSYVRVLVIDQGCGIPLEFQSHIFEKFSRAHNEKNHSQGTGLGLHISKNIVEQMGGVIGFKSEPGQGSTFYFEFPIYEEA
jgi:PAS domain S-box-containing protein